MTNRNNMQGLIPGGGCRAENNNGGWGIKGIDNKNVYHVRLVVLSHLREGRTIPLGDGIVGHDVKIGVIYKVGTAAKRKLQIGLRKKGIERIDARYHQIRRHAAASVIFPDDMHFYGDDLGRQVAFRHIRLK